MFNIYLSALKKVLLSSSKLETFLTPLGETQVYNRGKKSISYPLPVREGGVNIVMSAASLGTVIVLL